MREAVEYEIVTCDACGKRLVGPYRTLGIGGVQADICFDCEPVVERTMWLVIALPDIDFEYSWATVIAEDMP